MEGNLAKPKYVIVKRPITKLLEQSHIQQLAMENERGVVPFKSSTQQNIFPTTSLNNENPKRNNVNQAHVNLNVSTEEDCDFQVSDCQYESMCENVESKSFIWTTASTLQLLDLYKLFRNKVGTLQIRNFKKLWQVISEELRKRYNVVVTSSNCENRWRVLERNYKKFVDNKNQTGAGKKTFEFSEQMDEIFAKKKNIKPAILLESTTKSIPPKSPNNELETDADASNENTPSAIMTNNKRPRIQLRKVQTRSKYNESLERIRRGKEDRHKEKLLFEKEKFEKLYNLEKKKQEAMEKRNNLLEESNILYRDRNNLIKQLVQKDGCAQTHASLIL